MISRTDPMIEKLVLRSRWYLGMTAPMTQVPVPTATTAPWYKKVALGLSARTEFVMPYFTINFGIGHNFVNAHTFDLKGFYEILALKINVMQQAYLHIGYSLYDFYYPNNLMLGLGLHL